MFDRYLLAGGEVEVYVLFTYFDLTMFSRLSSGKSPTPGRWYQVLFFVNVHGVLWVLFLIDTVLYLSMHLHHFRGALCTLCSKLEVNPLVITILWLKGIVWLNGEKGQRLG